MWAVVVSLGATLALAAAAVGWAGTHRAEPGAQSEQNEAGKGLFNRKPFTADMVVTGRGNGKELHGKMYAGAHALRMDMEVQPGMESTMIARYDKKVVWMLLPGRREYMEMPISPRAGLMATLRDRDAKVELHDLGAEKIGQYECEKYRVHSTMDGQESSGLVWVGTSGTAKGFIVRVEDEKSGSVSEFRDIQPGEPPASVFELPAGYQKMQMPGMPGMPHQ
jgi:hypothetical protein